MKVNFEENGNVQIDDARIIYKNFTGEGGPYNREGDRKFSVIIDDEEICKALMDEGWMVKVKPPREEGDIPFMQLPVKLKYSKNGRGPSVYLQSGSARNKLDEDSISLIDHVDIARVDLDIRPYDWEVNGKSGRTAYLKAMYVVQNVDRFADRLNADEFPGEMPWE